MESWGVKLDNRLSRFVRCPDCERIFTSAAVALLHACHKAKDRTVRLTLEEWIQVEQ